MEQLKYDNIFDAIADDPKEAADLKFRADLMLVIRERVRGYSQAQIGRALGVPQPRVSELLSGKIDLFSSDKLIGILAQLGVRFRPAVVQTKRTTRFECDVTATAVAC
jgi:predicted XRE-type DNA-binding protein